MAEPVLDVVERFLECHFRLNPVDATFAGVHAHDHQLPDWSPAGLDRAVGEMLLLRAMLPGDAQRGGDVATPGSTAEIDRRLADAALEIRIAEFSGPHFHRGNPSLWAGEAIFGIIALMTREFAPIEDRAHSAAIRMDAMAAFLTRAIDTVADAPAAWTARALRECEGADLLFGSGVDLWMAGATGDHAARASGAARRARAAFAAFVSWLRALPPADDRRYGCGRDMLELLVRRGHGCTRPLNDLLAEAREHFEEAEARLGEMARAVAPGGWPEVRERLSARHPSADGYLFAYQGWWDACRAVAADHRLLTWPAAQDWPLRYTPIPRSTRQAAPFLYYLSYRSPAPLDPVRVHDYAVSPLDSSFGPEEQERFLRAHNDSVIKLNHVAHHGAIGHHVQNYYAARAPTRIGQLAAVDGASRIGLFCGGTMAEGWACYATDLMDECGFLTEAERVAQQHTRVRMLARAIVDIEIHTGAMSLDVAAAFYREHAGMAHAAAHAEAVKNSMFPGTAMMYWLGTKGIHDLRASLSPGSLRAFHDNLLSHGSIPVSTIASLMREEGKS
jgi:hypothetical protein